MPRTSKTRQAIDILASRGSILILGVITLWLGIAVAKETYRKHQIQAEITRLKAEITALEEKNNNLGALITSFNEPANIEAEAKKRLNLKKPGEEVAVILRDKNDDMQNIVKPGQENFDDALDPAVQTGDEPAGSSNSAKWWGYITDN